MLGKKHGHLDITRHIAPDQAQFEPEYFLALTEGGPPLSNLIGQCFQDISLTERNKVVRKQCLNDNYLASNEKGPRKILATTIQGSIA
jgi:hypothetical protein